MTKSIQSNSYRSYSETLLDEWIKHFGPTGQPDESFLVGNLRRCLNDFRDFAFDFDKEAKILAENDKTYMSLNDREKENFHLWLKERINKALDVYWAPLSQAATQYTSPAYRKTLDKLTNMEEDIEQFLNNLNSLTGATGDTAITIHDILLSFDELTLIRLAPYTKTALIGIPFRVFDSNTSKDEMLAGIAHELGHFLYWRLDDFDKLDMKHKNVLETIGGLLKNKLSEKQQIGIRFINAWFEELFADFIGGNIAKDVYVRSTKDMVIRNNKNGSESGSNDQEHVSDILRPLVSIYTVNRDSERSIESWRSFLKNDFPVDPSTIMIKVLRENKDQRDIERSPEELSPILLHTIDTFTEKIKNVDGNGLFRPHFSNISNVETLSRKAVRLANKLTDKKRHSLDEDASRQLSALDIFLEPQTLEAGAQSHPHTVTTPAHNYSFTVYHTHY